jgi:hypothetical protein
MTSPYLRAATKFPELKVRAKERLDKRQGKLDKPDKPIKEDKPDKPAKPDKPNGKVRAREVDGTFKADDPATPVVDEAWVDSVVE